MAVRAAANETALKILMTSDAVGGVWQYCVDLVHELTRHSCEVLVANIGPPPSAEQKERLLASPRVALEQGDFAVERMTDPWPHVDASCDWLLQLASDFHPDIVHLNGYSHAALTWHAPVLIVGHSCVYSWWKAVHGCAPGLEWTEYHKRVSEGLDAADAIVTPSTSMANKLSSEYGVESSRVSVIHNFSLATGNANDVKQDFILSAGRLWDKAKNLWLLNEIAPHIAWEIHVAGPQRGPEEAASVATALRPLGLLPYDELLDEMRRAAIFVHPALYEPFGLTALEAASRRCCLVLADIPSLRELWDGAAVFADPRRPEQWISKINALINDREARELMGDRACKRALTYNADAAANAYLDLYQHVIASPRRQKDVAA